MMNLSRSGAAFEEARNYMPGGVNSPARALAVLVACLRTSPSQVPTRCVSIGAGLGPRAASGLGLTYKPW